MAEALDHFESSEFNERILGKDIHQHLIRFYRNEINKYEKNITKWEYNRYFDLI